MSNLWLQSVAKTIIGIDGEKWVEYKPDGAHLRDDLIQFDTSQVLHWKYACELDDSDSPNPLTAPALPFPFTANQLTAFMLDGVGAAIASRFGNWEDGPDQGMLDSMGVLAREPKRAITEAYASYMGAQATVGGYPVELQQRADRLCKIYSYRNRKANTREGVFTQGIERDEANARRARAVASNAELEELYELATKDYQTASGAWRKAMVNRLLVPAPVVTAVSRKKRTDLLSPLISKAQRECIDPSDGDAVFLILRKWVADKVQPFFGISETGLQWTDANDNPQELTLKALKKRLSRQ